METLSIVVPCYNEIATIADLLTKVHEAPLSIQKEIIVVDDGSTDGTSELLTGPLADKIDCLIQKENGGKGSALEKGFRAATGDYLIIQDADLEYDPNDYEALLQPLLSGNAKVVYGTRFKRSDNKPSFYFLNYWANRFLTALSNRFTKQDISDMETCYKVLKKEVYSQLKIKEQRFGIEPEITAKISYLNIPITEIPIRYDGRKKADGKKIGWKDGLEAILCIIYYGKIVPSKLKKKS